jgi:hypothetical protein
MSHFIARQQLSKHFPQQRIHATKDKLLDELSVGLCIPLSLLGNNSVQMSYQKKVGYYFFPELILTAEFFSRGSSVRGFILELFGE